MCFSSAASFAVSVPLLAGGGYCLYKSLRTNKRYTAMALMPLAVGLQQVAEGAVWWTVNEGMLQTAHWMAIIYLFFVWVFWPFWVPYMTYTLEYNTKHKRRQLIWALIGLGFGLLLYIPHLFMPRWLEPQILQNCMAYNTVVIPDYFIPRWATAILYLFIISIAPLISSHFYIRRFGYLLLMFVPITYLFFEFAYLSVLCFFAAIVTTDLIYIIVKDKCRIGITSNMLRQKSLYVPKQQAS